MTREKKLDKAIGCIEYFISAYAWTSDEAESLGYALELLKAQEPVKPTWKNGYPLCGKCGFKLHWIVELNNYCANCGRAVKWDAVT